MHKLACKALKNLQASVEQKKTSILRTVKHLPEIKFYNQNFIKADFSTAHIIFINATCYPVEFWDNLIEKFNQLTVGARIIITSKKINSPYFESIYSGVHLMSWGMNSVRIYKKIGRHG